MSHQSREPEYILEESEKTHHMERLQASSIPDYQAVQADLALLYQELNISVDILGRIRDSVLVLEQSLGEQQ